ncbi:MAG: hypothetical protein B7Z37_17130 [Verrucomicrobia bacterium 12-59-8]|nr:MAG: hypothetical protein B7Z37_17130 [Verrucomicrobia bacterium 12-59-8]
MKTPSSAHQPQGLPISVATAAVLLAFTSFGFASTIELNQPYVPAGANYSITALQNLTPLTLDGGTPVGANPNVNFEFQGGFGVRYQTAYGQLTDFGIGLYDASCAPGIQTASTGLSIAFDHLVSSHGLSATLGDFDLDEFSIDANPGKVAPTISIYGNGGLLLGNFSTADIIAGNAMSLLTSNDPITQTDLWKLNLDALVGPNVQISGFTLAADTHNGSGSLMAVESEPYFFVAVNGGDCAMVPEPGSAFLILSAGIGTLIVTRRRSRDLFSAK